MNRIGQALVVMAFIGGAYLASLDPVRVNWMLFVPIMILGIAGAVLVKRSARAAASHSHRLASDRSAMEQSLENIIASLERLEASKDSIPTYDMRFEIDHLLRVDLDRFADARDSMKVLFGLQAFADIMSAFAAGERYINRVWSASTDGYQDEVLDYVGKSLRQFHDARDVYRRCASAASP